MEKLFLFGVDDCTSKKINQIAVKLKIRCTLIPPTQYNQTLEAIVSGKSSPLSAPPAGPLPTESLLLMCDFSDKRMDRLLFSLRQASISIDFKAMLTPTNKKWTVLQLLLELHREKAAYDRL